MKLILDDLKEAGCSAALFGRDASSQPCLRSCGILEIVGERPAGTEAKPA